MDDKQTAVDRCEIASTGQVDKTLQWKRDLLLLPILGTMHMILFLDRTNIANARIEGLEAGLNMPPTGYSTALWIFYVPFILAEIPSNLILVTGKVKPNLFLGGQMFLLGMLWRSTEASHTDPSKYAIVADSDQVSSECVKDSRRATKDSGPFASSWAPLRWPSRQGPPICSLCITRSASLLSVLPGFLTLPLPALYFLVSSPMVLSTWTVWVAWRVGGGKYCIQVRFLTSKRSWAHLLSGSLLLRA